MRFVDVTNDVAFRKIFGNEKKTVIIISFLNAVLKLEGDDRIEEITIINPYQLPRVAGEKASIIDVRAKDKRDRQFIIEMQVADAKGFDKRVQYYTCRDYSMQIDQGDKYPLLRPTYFIGILDFPFLSSPGYLSHHLILNGETYEHKLTDIQFTFIELQKFHKEVDELESLIEKWVFFIKNAENLDVIPDNTDDEGLIEAYRDADKHSWDKEELIAYDNFTIAIQDARGRLLAAEDRGKAKGRANEKEDVIARSLEAGMSLDVIAKIVDLPFEEVQAIVDAIHRNEGD